MEQLYLEGGTIGRNNNKTEFCTRRQVKLVLGGSSCKIIMINPISSPLQCPILSHNHGRRFAKERFIYLVHWNLSLANGLVNTNKN